MRGAGRRRSAGSLLLWGVAFVAVITIFALWVSSSWDSEGVLNLKGSVGVGSDPRTTVVAASAKTSATTGPNDDLPLEMKARRR